MKTLWRHENAGIIGFKVRKVIIVINNKTKVVLFCLHTRYHFTWIFTHPISKNIDQLRSIELFRKIMCVCNKIAYSSMYYVYTLYLHCTWPMYMADYSTSQYNNILVLYRSFWVNTHSSVKAVTRLLFLFRK